MPRIRQCADKYKKEDFLREIDAQCAWNGIKTQESLGKFLGVSAMTITNFRREPELRQISLLQSVVKKLKPDPELVLLFLGYSSQDIKKFAKEYVS